MCEPAGCGYDVGGRLERFTREVGFILKVIMILETQFSMETCKLDSVVQDEAMSQRGGSRGWRLNSNHDTTWSLPEVTCEHWGRRSSETLLGMIQGLEHMWRATGPIGTTLFSKV